MTALTRRVVSLRRRIGSRELRLGSGLVLGLFLLLHMINLGLGLVSVAAMDAARPVLMDPWSTPPGTILLGGAAGIHVALTLRTLYLRRTLRLDRRQTMQFAFGLLVPLLVASHVVDTRIVPAYVGRWPDFHQVVTNLWIHRPGSGARQAILLVVAWAHVGLGLWFWLRSKPGFARYAQLFVVAIVVVPLLGLLGFAEAARELLGHPVTPFRPPDLWAVQLGMAIQAGFAALVGTTLLARGGRSWLGRGRRIRVTYPDGRFALVPAGASVLEASRMLPFPHVAVCGGRGRCSTCRIRVPEGLDRQPPPSGQESITLKRFRAAPDIRLACQLRPAHDLAVFPIFASGGTPARIADSRDPSRRSASHERELAVLFCDLRGFTRQAELLLPFDTVYLLNRYFELVGRAVDGAGGHVDKFIGDGALALFGLATARDDACRQAVVAAAAIAQGLEALNAELPDELAQPLRIAMGLHAGPSIVGEMGYGQTIGLTAVGDAVNVASRLEGTAKELDVEAVISLVVAQRAGLDASAYPQRRIALRGREAKLEALLVSDAAALEADLREAVARVVETSG